MRSTIIASLAALAVAAPAPVEIEERQAAINDGQILNYALTLEHLESVFYQQALQKFSARDFRKAGVSSDFYGNLQEIASDEKIHVNFLTTALNAAGVTPVAECTYNFGITDVNSFLATANILEGVGVSAYLGAAQFIANKAYLTYAGSILTVEARHSAYLRRNQLPPTSPFPSPFDIPLGFNQVYSLAAQFIVSCPKSNPPLPVMAFPALTLTSGSPVRPGDKLSLTAAKSVSAKGAYFITTTGPVSAQISGSGKSYTVVVPKGVQAGQEYLVLTSDTNPPTDDNTVAGPAIIPVQDNDQGNETGGKSWGKSWDYQDNRDYHH